MRSGGGYEVWVWTTNSDSDGESKGRFQSKHEAKEEFDRQVLDEAVVTAGVYDKESPGTRRHGVPDRALWTFPSQWDGHL